MEKNNDIFDELKTISPMLAEIPKINIQSLPHGYFETLADKISIYSQLNQESKKQEFNHQKNSLPSGYFENLSDSILFKVNEMENKEIEESFPLLNSLKNLNVYEVPENYFDHLSDRILSGIQPQEKGKVISLSRRNWWKYMAAAIIAGVMLFSSLYFNNNDNKIVSPYLTAANEYQTSSKIAKGIQSLDDDEIIQYLETNGNITDNDVILNNFETDKLPAEIDYLMDDNTLNNYLDKIDI